MESGITEHNLHNALRRGVFAENSLDLFPDRREHLSIIIARYNRVRMNMRPAIALPLVLFLSSCSSSPTPQPVAQGQSVPQVESSTTSKHRYAKLIELAGFRVTEKSPGHLEVRFGAVNHSIADLGEVGLTVNLKARTAKEEEPPFASFPCKVSLGPLEWKDVVVDIPTKLRVYELPDWQFIRATFDITSPET